MDLQEMLTMIVGGVILWAMIIKVIRLSRDRRSVQERRNYRPANTYRQTQPSVPHGQNETGTVIYFAENPHNLPDNEYRFNFKRVGNSWRAYILRTPSFGGRNTSAHIIHRLNDNGRYYVCWDSPVATLRDMQTISRVWANNIQEYIATGRGFG